MEYSEHILPVVEGKCLPQCKLVLEDGKWKKVWWYPEPEDLEPEEAQWNNNRYSKDELLDYFKNEIQQEDDFTSKVQTAIAADLLIRAIFGEDNQSNRSE
jgi:hypothetical protein